ncbi:MAG: hypothetical protein HOI95_03410 [Chromatiales bacterium]|nr:hypothetical protein [Chromatiales bacterium]
MHESTQTPATTVPAAASGDHSEGSPLSFADVLQDAEASTDAGFAPPAGERERGQAGLGGDNHEFGSPDSATLQILPPVLQDLPPAAANTLPPAGTAPSSLTRGATNSLVPQSPAVPAQTQTVESTHVEEIGNVVLAPSGAQRPALPANEHSSSARPLADWQPATLKSEPGAGSLVGELRSHAMAAATEIPAAPASAALFAQLSNARSRPDADRRQPAVTGASPTSVDMTQVSEEQPQSPQASVMPPIVAASDRRGGTGHHLLAAAGANWDAGTSPVAASAPAVATIHPPGVPIPGAVAAQGLAIDIEPAVNTARWEGVVGGRLLMLARNGTQSAELILNPPQLGRLDVRIAVDQDQATVQFVSTHAAVREALEAALPRFRDMMSDGGLNLADVDISQQHAGTGRQLGEQGENADEDGPSSASDDAPKHEDRSAIITAGEVSLVDDYV